MAVREFGIRELRNHTSRVLEAVRAGDVVYLTNRGSRVAEIRATHDARPIEALVAKAAALSTGDTGAFEELIDSKQADLEAQQAKDDALWG
ncbi:type II toxin-antitoxin system Phd/YefM family antitoxin [Nocardioides humi]|uniref:Antitoxin n=1 Tax=Nocardioides humi TaxID=449461 RepID=A0ABN2BZJ5_9ACTN|nr:type II toxin-antitoxin system prevent-host-death family antitoxin [Nocardioides humi]